MRTVPSVLAWMRPIAPGWRGVLTVALLAGLVMWLYAPMLAHLARQWWDDENYSHGFLIPLMSAYFVWERRERLRQLPVVPSWLGLGLVVVAVGLFVLASLAAELFTMRLSLLGVLGGLVLYLGGRERLKTLAFPILYLLFMIPPPAIVFNAVAFPLQLFAARTATASLELLDVPVLREGNVIALANTTLEVAEACSGIRSLLTLLALAATFAYFSLDGRWRRGILVASAVPIAIVANATRVVGTGFLAHHYGAGVADGFFHTFSGWLVFVIAAVLLGAEGFLLVRLSRGARVANPQGSVATGSAPRSGAAAESRGPWLRTAAASVVLGAGIISTFALSHGEAIPLRRPLDDLPSRIGAWQGIQESLTPAVLGVLRLSDYVMRLYAGPQLAPIWVYVGYYESQRQGQIIHSPQQCLPGAGWNIISRQDLMLHPPGGARAVTINRVLIGKGEDRQVVLYWYQERGRVIASEYAAKLYLLLDAIAQNRTDGALVRLSAPVRGSEEETVRQLVEFTRLIFPHLTEFLPGESPGART